MPLTTIEKAILALIVGLIIFIILYFVLFKSGTYFEKQAIITQLNSLASHIQDAENGIQKETEMSLGSILKTSVIIAQKGNPCSSNTDCPSYWTCLKDETDNVKKCYYSKTEYDLCRAYARAHGSEEVQDNKAYIYYLFEEEQYACIVNKINSLVELYSPPEIPEYAREVIPKLPTMTIKPEFPKCYTYSLTIRPGEQSGRVAIVITNKKYIC